MPNTLTTVFTSTPASEPVEAPHPNTGVYVLGTQLGNLSWQVIHTGVSKTATAPTMVGRLKNFPAVTASIVANGNVLNNVPLAPTGTSATGTTTTNINITASTSPNGLANRILVSDAAAGPFVQVYQGTASSYPHTVTAGATKYYRYQYVGAGFYDDSPLSAVFSGVATNGYQLAMLTDSRGAYPGDTGTNLTTSVWALAQARLTSGSTYTGTIVHHGYPGAAAANLVDPNYTNSNQYVTAKTAGQSAVQYLVSQLDPTKTPIIVVSAGANGGTAADIKAIHDALRAAVPGAITIVDPILNRLDPSFASGLPNRAATNASLAAGVGVYAQDTVQSYDTPQVYADDAPNNGLYFWNPDTISGLSKVHLTTAGNQLQGESYAQAYARRLGLVLTPLAAATGAGISQTYTQYAPLLHYYSDTNDWTNFSPNAQYITGYGGVSASAVASFGFQIACYGWRLVGPNSNLFGSILAKEAGVTVATGTQFANVAAANATAPAVQITQYYSATLALHTIDFYKDPATPGQYLQANCLQFCDAAGTFPAIPPAGVQPVQPPGQLINWVSPDAGATVANYVASRDATAAAWMVGFSGQTFAAPTGTQKVRLDLGELTSTPSAVAAMIMGFGPAASLSASPRYAGIPRSWYRDKVGNAEVFEGGAGHAGVYTAGTGGRLYIDIYADRTEFWMDGVLKTADTITAANTGTLQVFLALKDSNSTCTNARYVLP